MAQVMNRYTVSPLGIVVDDGGEVVALVSEYMEGKELKDLLKSKMSLFRKLKALIQVATGMAWMQARSAKLVHRDLKLDNILVDGNGDVKINDFGFALLLKEHETVKSCDRAGTPKYMAPETWTENSSVVAEKTDVYSFGMMLWEMMTEQEAWSGLSIAKIENSVFSDERPALELLPKELQPLSDLIQRCWDGDFTVRPTFSCIIKELRQFMWDYFIPGLPTEPWQEKFSINSDDFFKLYFGNCSGARLKKMRQVLHKLEIEVNGSITLEGLSLLQRWFPRPKGMSLDDCIYLSMKDWFWGRMDKLQTDGKLAFEPPGTYIIRLNSVLREAPWTLTRVTEVPGNVAHHHIYYSNGLFSVGEKQPAQFRADSLFSIIPHLEKHFKCPYPCRGSQFPSCIYSGVLVVDQGYI
eukprot:TRINITY_DN8706_c0_g1_i1.p1 TRINITY_DN8706_c0_g1~~TRINITY_DN8706_c0_g1_i1.p1  ORF type:complete len:476 (-),score=57.89 TRINITY_DN8706_c0_g1_i1:75-1304(-)